MNEKRYRVISSVTNDLVADQRVYKTANSLRKSGYDVLLVGRRLRKSFPAPSGFKTKRFRLLFRKKALFYAEYNIRLFFFLLFTKADLFLSNDLDTLPANYLASKLKRNPVVYDSHEYFTEVPELVHRKRVQRLWERMEARILPKLKYSYTVCASIADRYHEKYGIAMKTVRNIPEQNPLHEDYLPDCLAQITSEKIIIYQGAVNIGRGLEQAIQAMEYVKDAVLVIVGDGDIKHELEELAARLNLNDKVIFAGKVPFNRLSAYTKRADVGLCIEENIGLNYYYALPNKLFDYIRAEVPILASRLPEIEKIVNTYDIGCFIELHEPMHMAEQLNDMLYSENLRNHWKTGLKKASGELSWENEEKVLLSVFNETGLR
jgi:glycosyltransferase involved in cell wall biosynthesis